MMCRCSSQFEAKTALGAVRLTRRAYSGSRRNLCHFITKQRAQARYKSASEGLLVVNCLLPCDQSRPDCDWEVRVAESWDAVRCLGQVSSLATDVFYKNEGFEPFINFSKLIYRLELFLRLGLRVSRLESKSCFAIAHAADTHQGRKELAGILEMSIQIDLPTGLAGSHQQAAVITTMAVLPSMQRQGIGTALLDEAQHWAAAKDAMIIALFVYRDNAAAIRLYERLHFERVVKWVDPVWLASAEKGMIGPTRRILYIRRLPDNTT